MQDDGGRVATGAGTSNVVRPSHVRPWCVAARVSAVAGALAGIVLWSNLGERAEASVMLIGSTYILAPFAIAWWGAGSRSDSAGRCAVLTGLNLLGLGMYVAALRRPDMFAYPAALAVIFLSPFQLLSCIVAIVATRRRGSPRGETPVRR
jgi:hypothetical protein